MPCLRADRWMTFPKPDDSHGDHPERLVLLAALVVASGDGTELLGAGECVLDLVAQPVCLPVEAAAAALVARVTLVAMSTRWRRVLRTAHPNES